MHLVLKLRDIQTYLITNIDNHVFSKLCLRL